MFGLVKNDRWQTSDTFLDDEVKDITLNWRLQTEQEFIKRDVFKLVRSYKKYRNSCGSCVKKNT